MITADSVSIVEELVAACFARPKMLCEKRRREFECLDRPSTEELSDLLARLSKVPRLDRMEGFLQIRQGKEISARAVCSAMMNITCKHICRVLDFARRKSLRYGGLEQAAQVHPELQTQLSEAISLIEPLVWADKRWPMLRPEHAESLAEELQGIQQVVALEGLGRVVGTWLYNRRNRG